MEDAIKEITKGKKGATSKNDKKKEEKSPKKAKGKGKKNDESTISENPEEAKPLKIFEMRAPMKSERFEDQLIEMQEVE